jgi:hypothetical protein
MTSNSQPNPVPQDMTTAMLQVAEAFAPVVAQVGGYRAQLMATGFSPAAADQMATDYHRELVATMFASLRAAQ